MLRIVNVRESGIYSSILQASVPSRPKLTTNMGDIADMMEDKIKTTLFKTRCICVTSDIWSSLKFLVEKAEQVKTTSIVSETVRLQSY